MGLSDAKAAFKEANNYVNYVIPLYTNNSLLNPYLTESKSRARWNNG